MKITWLTLALTASAALAHVPYIEAVDFGPDEPFRVPKSIDRSIAVYGWLAPRTGGDVDYLVFETDGDRELFVEILVPQCEGYETFRPSFAIIGPGLPTAEGLPVEVPEGHGAIVVGPGEDEWGHFYEPFGGKSYWRGPNVTRPDLPAGEYRIVVWSPGGHTGDYVIAVGREEVFDRDDIARALVITPLIRLDLELHSRRRRRDS